MTNPYKDESRTERGLTPKPLLSEHSDIAADRPMPSGVTLARSVIARPIQAHRLKALDESFHLSHQRFDADNVQWCSSHGCPPDSVPQGFARARSCWSGGLSIPPIGAGSGRRLVSVLHLVR